MNGIYNYKTEKFTFNRYDTFINNMRGKSGFQFSSGLFYSIPRHRDSLSVC